MARTGDIVHIPRHVKHRFTNTGYRTAEMLFLYTPGGVEGMFVEGGDEPRPGVQVEHRGQERFMTEFIQDLYVKYDVEPLPDQE